MTVLLKNNAQGFLANAISSSDSSITLTSGGGAVFPGPSSGEYFYATLSTIAGTNEIVKCTSRSGDVLTVVRGQEGTVATAFPASSRIELRVTAQSISDAISDKNNASFIVYNPSGTGAVATTVQTKLREIASVTDYGAVGDGVADDTTAIQNALTANDAVFFPAGTYKVTAPIILKSNNYAYGEGASSVIAYYGSVVSQGAFFAKSGSPSIYVENLTISNLKFLGQVAAQGFSEFIHLISLCGVRNCVVENCVIEGFRGDGILLGSSDVAAEERHNVNVTIRDCYIDGVNKDNRNGISVIDGTGITIENNFITRTTRSNMPGGIDIEPDAYTFHVIRDISILNNTLLDIGGNVSAIAVYMPGVTYTTPPNGFTISGNYIETVTSYGIFFNYDVAGGISENTAQLGIQISDNVIKPGGGRGLVFFNANDMVVENNTIVGGATSLFGYTPTNYNLIDCAFNNNMFVDVQSTSFGYAVAVYTGTRLKFEGNIFKNCGNAAGPGGGGAVVFTTGTTSYVSFINNSFFSNTGVTVRAIHNDGHTFTATTNTFIGNAVVSGTNGFSSESIAANMPSTSVQVLNRLPHLGIKKTPSLPLDVKGGAAEQAARFEADNGQVIISGTDGTVNHLVSYINSTLAFMGTGGNHSLVVITNNAERCRFTNDGNFVMSGATARLGYGVGTGGTVTQATSRTTGVTLNKSCGEIVLVSAAGTTVYQTFTVTNSQIAATDTIIVNQKSGTDKYIISVTKVQAGSFDITFATTGGTTTEQPVFSFSQLLAVAS